MDQKDSVVLVSSLVSRRIYIMHRGEKVDVTDGIPERLRAEYGDDLGRLSGFLAEEVWDTKPRVAPKPLVIESE